MDISNDMAGEKGSAVIFEEDTVAGNNSRNRTGLVTVPELPPDELEIEKAEQMISDSENATMYISGTDKQVADLLPMAGNDSPQTPTVEGSSGEQEAAPQLSKHEQESSSTDKTHTLIPPVHDSDVSALLPTLEEIVAAKEIPQQSATDDRHYDASPSTQSTEVRECESDTVLQYQREINHWRSVLIEVVRKLQMSEGAIPDRLCGETSASSLSQALCAEIERLMTIVNDKGKTRSGPEAVESHKHASITQPAPREESIAPPEPQWELLAEEAGPEPSYDLDSPVISHLLSTWTTDRAKADFLRCWVRSLYDPHYEALGYPPGLQVNNLSCVLKDGFVIMLVPLVRMLSKYPVEVHVRRHLRATDPTGRVAGPCVEDAIDDPFAQEESALYDLRIKRTDLTITTPAGDAYAVPHSAGLGMARTSTGAAKHPAQTHPDPVPTLRSRSDDGVAIAAAGGVSHASSSRANRPRLDSSDDYYSPLSEINSFLPVIEAQTKLRVNEPYDPHPHVHRAAPPLRREVNPLGGPAPAYHPDADHTVVNPAPPSGAAATPTATQAPSLLHALFGWWGPAPTTAGSLEVTTAGQAAAPQSRVDLATPTSAPDTASGAKLGSISSAPDPVTEPVPATSDSIASITAGRTTTDISQPATSGKSATTTAPMHSHGNSERVSSPTSAPSPMNKIAERLQQIREQKLQYQAKHRPDTNSGTGQANPEEV